MKIDQMAGNIRMYITKETKTKALKKFPQIEFCGACPFLLINKEEHKTYSYMVEQKNNCLLMKSPCLWKIDKDGIYNKVSKEYHVAWLDDGKNPKRNKQCLNFAIYLIKQCDVQSLLAII